MSIFEINFITQGFSLTAVVIAHTFQSAIELLEFDEDDFSEDDDGVKSVICIGQTSQNNARIVARETF